MNQPSTALGTPGAGTPGAWASAMGTVPGRLDLPRVRRLAGWAIFVTGALHGLAQALPLLTRGA
ncbi:hypothetical protein [Azohydromonas australica]|uniref:hypothetical protein n=1 Tax=Azohydromonas australica TaxID=364039 RepID=UPI000491E43D|nr:hypothetical protein [Azohydromonas australica]